MVMMGNGTPQASFRIGDGKLAYDMESRGDAHGLTAKRDLTRYYNIVDRELLDISLTPEQALTIVQAYRPNNSDQFDESEILYLPSILFAKLGQFTGPDKHASVFMKIIASWSIAARCAVADAVERYHRLPQSLTEHEKLIRVGLLKTVDIR